MHLVIIHNLKVNKWCVFDSIGWLLRQEEAN